MLIAAYRGPKLLGIVPWCELPQRVDGGRKVRLVPLGFEHSDYHAWLIRDGELQVADALRQSILRLEPTGVDFYLPEVPRGSALAYLCADGWARRHGVGLASSTPCPRLVIADQRTFVDGLLAKPSLKRKARALGALGAVRVEHTSDRHVILQNLDALFEMHVHRWSGSRWPSLFCSDHNRAFYRAFVASMSSGTILLTTLSAGRRIAAMHLGLVSGRDLIWYKPAFNTEFSRCSPGDVMLGELIAYLRGAGFDTLDFSRGDEPFKQRFSNDLRYNDSFIWARTPWRRIVARSGRFVAATWRRLSRRAPL
jgi:CelD/BcsL family acetyltransferase involved in cellulose biosynthesis